MVATTIRTLLTISKGARLMIAASFFFSIMSLLVKVAGERLPSSEIVLARGLVSLVLSYFLLRWSPCH